MAVLWPRLNERGAFWALMVGFLIGSARMALDFIYREPACAEIDERPLLLRKVHYMYFAIILFWSTIISAVFISYMTDPPEPFRVSSSNYHS